MHFRLDFITEANTTNPDQTAPNWEQSDLGPYCSQLKMCLLFMSAAYIKVHFRLDLITEANTMNPDQTAPNWEQADLGPY